MSGHWRPPSRQGEFRSPVGSPLDAVRSELFERRTVTSFGRLDDLAASDLCAQLMTLDALGDDPIELVISSGGGTLGAALAVIDVLDLLGVPVRAVAVGELTGPPVAVLAVCAHRLAAPHARFRLEQERVAFSGDARSLLADAEAQARRQALLAARVAQATGRKPANEVAEDFSRGLALSAEEARRYGLVDEVGAPAKRPTRLAPAGGLGFRPRG